MSAVSNVNIIKICSVFDESVLFFSPISDEQFLSDLRSDRIAAPVKHFSCKLTIYFIIRT